ncbi:CDP-glycerol--glycerophosphate glycerophosphotransferase [Vibrio rarus]|uniref:CDP-glycerol--glycerophosphate glycerophosphotransferase n=1 Tax=Vibrio rarus TaxID=413403 RepID=UPI0021C2DE55|nr:CDP-glycerol--glycerophosphate glycerophosphotransferase [Vibrio rarus]
MNCINRRYLMYISQNYSYAILRPLQQYILSQGGEVRWFLEGDEVNPSFLSDAEIQITRVSDVIQWNPDAVFVPGNMVPNFIPGLKVAVFHGFNAGKINRRGRLDHFEIRGCFDLYCTQGPETTLPFQRLAEKYKYFEVAETGWSALDPLFNKDLDNPYIDTSDTRPTVLMCSTFSRNLSCAPVLFEKIKELSLKGNWRWLIQFHPKMPQDVVEKYKALQNDNLQFIETDNVLPLLKAADVMLCDTSSVLIMFLMQIKPVVTFRNVSPQPYLLNVTDIDKVESMLTTALHMTSEDKHFIEEYVNSIHPYSDGMSSERVVSEVNQMLQLGRTVKKPMNLVREIKLRKKLSYWKL